MRNITIAVPDNVYRKARITAAQRDTSVSALVQEFLIGLSSNESDFERRKRLQDEVLASIRNFRAGDRLTRRQIHQRGRHAIR